MAVAAIIYEKLDERLHSFDVRPVNNSSSVARCTEQAGPHQNCKVRRKRVVRCPDCFSDDTRCNSKRFMLDQKLKDREPRRLRQCRESGNGVNFRKLATWGNGAGMARDRQHILSHLRKLSCDQNFPIFSGWSDDSPEQFDY
jgi:hypothetical protein